MLCYKDSCTTHDSRNFKKLVFFVYFHFIMPYGVTFWENSTDSKEKYIIHERKPTEQWQVLNKESLVENYLRSSIQSLGK